MSLFNFFKKHNGPMREMLSIIDDLNFQDKKKIVSLIKPAVLLDISSSSPAIGISKFGGNPDLGSEDSWPRFEGSPMVFFCQISTIELSKFDCGFSFEKKRAPFYISLF